MLDQRFNSDYDYELGMDEAGRGPLFGRLYVAGAILPKGNDFHHEWMKDSKRFLLLATFLSSVNSPPL